MKFEILKESNLNKIGRGKFTGFTDMNGEKIYVGDRVKDHRPINNKNDNTATIITSIDYKLGKIKFGIEYDFIVIDGKKLLRGLTSKLDAAFLEKL